MKWFGISTENGMTVIAKNKNIAAAAKVVEKSTGGEIMYTDGPFKTLEAAISNYGPGAYDFVVDEKGKELNGSKQAKIRQLGEAVEPETDKMKRLAGMPMLNESILNEFKGANPADIKKFIELTDPDDWQMYDSDFKELDRLIQKFDSEGTLEKAWEASSKAHFGKPNTKHGNDPLAWFNTKRITKAGKLHGQDLKALKARIKRRNNMTENFKVNSPTLSKLANMEYSDPREKDGCRIAAEKTGKYVKEGNVSDGNYIMYQDNDLPGKFIAVHVSDDINEDTGSANVNVVAIGTSKKNVLERMAYRMRRAKKS